MTRPEHLLTILAEECCEVGQRVSKALRFGPAESQPGDFSTNAERIMMEFHDLMAAVEMLQDEGALPIVDNNLTRSRIFAKKAKVEKYLAYSVQCGTLLP